MFLQHYVQQYVYAKCIVNATRDNYQYYIILIPEVLVYTVTKTNSILIPLVFLFFPSERIKSFACMYICIDIFLLPILPNVWLISLEVWNRRYNCASQLTWVEQLARKYVLNHAIAQIYMPLISIKEISYTYTTWKRNAKSVISLILDTLPGGPTQSLY